jgi:serine/threonine-protein kinase
VLPELADLTLEEATAKLEELGLVIAQADPAYSEDVEKGVVISWLVPESPALVAGGTVTKGTTVQVVVSNGPTPRVVPDLTNKSLADATAALTALNLEIDKGDDVFSPTAPAGTVAEQTPAKDTTLLPGDKVTVKMSKGPEMIAIPATKGLDYNGIVAALQTAGFTVGTVSGNVALAFIGFNVNGALAIPGMQFPKGTRVELFFKAK